MSRNGRRATGVRIRSRLNWMILRTRALDVKAPLAVAELIELMRIVTSWSVWEMYRRMRNPSCITSNLYRLSDRGYVKLQGLKRQREATLTPAGRRALCALEALYRDHGDGMPAADRFASLPDRLARLRRERLRRLSPTAMIRRMEAQRWTCRRRLPGPPKATVFVSDDLPRREGSRRRLIVAVLKGHLFRRIHQSMYVGPSGALRAVLETLEPYDVLSRCRGGTLTVFHP